MVDIFERLEKNAGRPHRAVHVLRARLFRLPELEARSVPHGLPRQEDANWSLNNYLRPWPTHPSCACRRRGRGPFAWRRRWGARLMSGQTRLPRASGARAGRVRRQGGRLPAQLGYQGMLSIIDCLLTPAFEVVVYDAEAHAASSRPDACTRASASSRPQRHGFAAPAVAARHRPGRGARKGVRGSSPRRIRHEGRPGQARPDRRAEERSSGSACSSTRPRFGRWVPAPRYGGPLRLDRRVDVLFNTLAQVDGRYRRLRERPLAHQIFRYNMRSQLYAKSVFCPMPMVICGPEASELIRNHPE